MTGADNANSANKCMTDDFFYAVQLPEVKGENVCLSNSSMRVQSGGTALLNRFHTVNLDRCFLCPKAGRYKV